MYQPKSYYADSSIKLPDYRLFSVWDVKCDDKYKYDNSKSTINPQFSYMYSLIRGINGAGSLQIKGTQIDLNANSIVIVRYLDIEEYRSLSPVWHYVWYNFYTDIPPLLYRAQPTAYRIPATATMYDSTDEISNLLSQCDYKATVKANLKFIEFYFDLCEILAKTRIYPHKYSKLLFEYKDFLTSHYTEPLNLTEVSNRLGFSDRYLRKLFTKMEGISPKEYISRLRMKNACLMLKNTTLSIAEISEYLGYSSQFYFSREFKKTYGLSPSQFRL